MPITRKEFDVWKPTYTKENGAYARILDLISKNPNTAYSVKELAKYLGYEDKIIIFKTKSKHGKIYNKKVCMGYSTIMQAIRKLRLKGYAEYKTPYLINK